MKLKRSLNNDAGIYDAGLKRVSDIDFFTLKGLSVDRLVKNYLDSADAYNAYIPKKRDIFSSYMKNISLKDAKFFVNLNNVRLKKIEREISNYIESTFLLLRKMQQEALGLESEIIESEIKYFKGSSNVHYNNFVKVVDTSVSENNRDFFIDHKTKFAFLSSENLSILKGVGLTLPIKSKNIVPIKNVYIINEHTTTGDTVTPIKVGNPLNVLRRNKVFEFSGVIKSIDNKYNYKRETATLALAIELGSAMPVNIIEINPSSIASFLVEEISYIDVNGKEIVINATEVDNNFKLTFFFSPIITNRIYIKVKQKTSIGSGEITKERDYKSKIYSRSNFISGTSYEEESLQGNVFDMSINEISTYLVSFNERGIFRSQVKDISNCNSFNIDYNAIIPSYEEIVDQYYKQYLLTLGSEPLVEAYAGLKVFDSNGKVLINQSIPLPDNKNRQAEHLDPIGRDCRFKLYPELAKGKKINEIVKISLEKICIDVEETIPGIDRREPNFDIPTKSESDQNTYTAENADDEEIGMYLAESGLTEELVLDWICYEHKVTEDNGARRMQLISNTGYEYGVLQGRTIRYNGEVLPANIYMPYRLKNTGKKDEEGKNIYSVRFITKEERIPTKGMNRNIIPKVAAINLANQIYNGAGLPRGHRRPISLTSEKLSKSEYLKLINSESEYGWKRFWNDRQWKELSSGSYVQEYKNKRFSNMDSRVKEEEGVVAGEVEQYRGSSPEREMGDTTVEERTTEHQEPSSDEAPLQECDLYYVFEFEQKHLYEPGDVLRITNKSETYTIEGAVTIIIDEYTVGIIVNANFNNLPTEYLGSFPTDKFITYNASNFDIEVYEEEKRLIVGNDYLISPDNGSTWYSSIPQSVYFKKLLQKCKAGDFLIRLRKVDYSKIYHCKYKIKSNQALSADRNVILKNMRIKLLSPLNQNEGIIQSIFIIRKGLKNQYLSPVIYEYSTNIFESNPKINKSGSLKNKSLKLKNTKDTLNVN